MFEVEENVIIYAFRYALGRQTYAPYEVAQIIIQNKDKFQSYTKQQIIYEIEDFFKKIDNNVYIKYPDDLRYLWENVLDVLKK